jgi:drug/metabolite transporter (DMT)-like permease
MQAPSSPLPPATALFALHGAVALFGFAGLFGKWIDWHPAAIVLGRTSLAALALAAIIAWRHGAVPRPSPTMAGNGVLLAVHWVAFFAAIQASTVAVGLLGFASFPLFVPLLERALLGVRRRRGAWLQAALVGCGLVLLVPEFRWQSDHLRGLGWGILSGFTFAWMTVRTRGASALQRPETMALWQNAIAALCVVPLVLWQGGTGGPVGPVVLLQVAVLAVVCTALAHTLYIASLTRVTASTASVVAALEPVYGIALAWWLLREVPDARTLGGAALLVAAAIVASRREPDGAPVLP